MDKIKVSYAERRSKVTDQTIKKNVRLFNTYNRISLRLTGEKLKGVNIDLGGGDGGFSTVCKKKGIKSYKFDYPEFDLEKDIIHQSDCSVDFATLNAVIEHINKPDHILLEINRVLKPQGLLFVRTPNWQMDFKNFYNDTTHVKPYTPKSIKRALELIGFNVIFLEPGLVEKKWFWWKLPETLKWRIAKCIRGGTKSILAVAKKNK